MLFLYKELLGKKIGLIQGVVRANRPKRLPIVLTKEEVRRVLDCLHDAPWLMAMILYGAGLRLLGNIWPRCSLTPPAYDRYMGRWSSYLAPMFIEFAQVRDGDKVLDVGCGTGVLSQAVAAVSRSSEITGIDPRRPLSSMDGPTAPMRESSLTSATHWNSLIRMPPSTSA